MSTFNDFLICAVGFVVFMIIRTSPNAFISGVSTGVAIATFIGAIYFLLMTFAEYAKDGEEIE